MTPRAGLAHASEETRSRAIPKWQDDPDRPHVFKYIAEEWLGGVFSESSVRSWIRDYQRTGIVKPASGAGSRFWVNRSLYSQHALDEMHRMLQEDNGLKPAEVLVKTHLRTGEGGSTRTTRRQMKKLDWSRNRAGTKKRRRNPALMQLHAQLRETFHPRQLCSADEMHKRGQDLRRTYGYGHAGHQSIVPLSPHLHRSWTVLGLFDYTGFVDWAIQELGSGSGSRLPKAVDRRLWLLMFREKVLPHLNPCDERQLPRSVLIMDNCSLHWWTREQRGALQAEVEAVGARLVFIPQCAPLSHSPTLCDRARPNVSNCRYCPRANAIEGGFSQVNKEIEDDIDLANADPEAALHQAFLRVGPEYGRSFVRGSTRVVRSWL